MTMDDLREKVARAMAATFNGDADPEGDLWEQWGGETDAVLAAIHASGHRIVPVEPTEEMLREGAAKVREFMDVRGPYPRAHAMYCAMLTAYGHGEILAGHYLSDRVFEGTRLGNKPKDGGS
jgi:hypothetical protein